MNADDCKKRAEESLAAAHFAPDHDARRIWRQVADLWQLWAQELDQIAAKNLDAKELDVKNIAAKVDRVAAEKNGTDAFGHDNSGKAKITEMADRLRFMLSLGEMSDA